MTRPPAARNLESGTRLGPHEIVEPLGEGGMERKRNEGGVPAKFTRPRCGVDVEEAYSRSRRARLVPPPRGCRAPRFPQRARLRNRGGSPGFPSARYAASSPEGRLRAGAPVT